MLRSSAAMASRVLRQLISSSKPSIQIQYLRPVIATATINPVVRHHHHQLFFSDPNSQFTGVQCRNYATGRSSEVDDDDDDEVDYENDEFVDDSDDECIDSDEFVDDSETDAFDEE